MREVLVFTLAALFGCGGRLALLEQLDADAAGVAPPLTLAPARPELDAGAIGCRPSCCADLERYRCEGDVPDARPRECAAVDVLPGPCDGWRCHVTNADGVLIMCN